jgi:hypothetical protein
MPPTLLANPNARVYVGLEDGWNAARRDADFLKNGSGALEELRPRPIWEGLLPAGLRRGVRVACARAQPGACWTSTRRP